MTSPGPGEVVLVEDEAALARVVERALGASTVALDTEANGLFAYEASLCVVQLGWREGGAVVVAIVDALATPVTALGPLVVESGPTKLLHDLTFDARMLAAAGLRLGRVRDTEVAGRLLGRKALGLASLLAEELGVVMTKTLQRHDWSRRPLGPEHLAYLAGDVAHLEALEGRLAAHVARLDLAPEVEEETRYKLASALAPEVADRPAWARVKGMQDLDSVGRAVLRRLLQARDRMAQERNVPPFFLLGSSELCAIAAARPRSPPELAARLASRSAGEGRDGGRLVAALLGAVAAGVEDGEVPPGEHAAAFPPAPPRAVTERRRRVEQAIGAWRRREATRRGWNEQAVLPGHCARELATAIGDPGDDAALGAAIRAISGLGVRRAAWFQDGWIELARQLAEPPSPPPAAT